MTSIVCRHYRERKLRPEWIVIHYPAMPGMEAKDDQRYFLRTSRPVSTNYIIDQIETIELLDCSKVAFHCGSSDTSLCGAYNGNSIGIDLCDSKLNMSSRKVEDHDWFIPENTCLRATKFIAELMRKFNIPLSHVIRHFDVTGKWCPRPFVGNDRNEFYGISGNEKWKWFKGLIEKELRNEGK